MVLRLMPLRRWAAAFRVISTAGGTLICAAEGQPPRTLSSVAARFGSGCQTRTVCASIERLGLYALVSLQGALMDSAAGREAALGGDVSVGFGLIRRVAIKARFATAAATPGSLAVPSSIGQAQARLLERRPMLYGQNHGRYQLRTVS